MMISRSCSSTNLSNEWPGEGQLAMYRHEGFWQCMDTYRDWRTLNDHWEEGNTPWLG